MLSKLQYISQGTTAAAQVRNVFAVLDYGADWIQVRWKNASELDLSILCEKIKKRCVDYNAVFIVNDHIAIAHKVDADGVHLGLTDDTIVQARNVLGKEKIIGGTANTIDNVVQRTNEGCNYIGLGPFRYTTTKEKLSPIIGLDGYRTIIGSLKEQGIAYPPIYAIGGIEVSDMEAIKSVGIHGIALSGLLTQQPQFISHIKNILSSCVR